MSVDLDRARTLFGDHRLGWIIDRLQARLERGGGVAARLRLPDPTPAQRDALQRLLGRRPTTAGSISVDCAELVDILTRAGIAPDLVALVEALRGPVVDRRGAAAAEQAAWRAVHEQLRAQAIAVDARLATWADELLAIGLLRRLAGDPESGRRLAARSLDVLRRLPARGASLAHLAASAVGDSHALDDGAPLATVVLRALETLTAAGERCAPAWEEPPARGDTLTGPARHVQAEPPVRSGEVICADGRARNAAAVRALWARVGVLCDELSAPVLVLGLRPAGDSLLAGMLRTHAGAGEPCRVTLRQLVRHAPDWSPLARSTVALCENPAVVAAAADRLGAACPPIICTDGQPSGAVQTLLRELVAAGATLRFHTDFDAGGVRIGNLLIERFGALPWRMATADYVAAAATSAGTVALASLPDRAVWDPDLVPAMTQRGVAVHEEQVIDMLVSDLATALNRDGEP